ncbi:hypothetical protein [Sporosarcina aquimarina]|uniref:Uncharacterized protein n=1 Tax=Sporosarcina aquimarina TaxID=114975 RepID=A0ABU4G0P6_9BACL|nr:hypothetical protein [Sporosarcina aquimarina]MDW0110456.1 hypothetical protein [Sporosarcina aquimarina]
MINHTVKTTLQRKMDNGERITDEDIVQAAEYAKAYGGTQSLALYASVKRAAAQQQDEE